MDRETDLPVPPAPVAARNPIRGPITNLETTSSSSSSSSSSAEPSLFRHVQAAFKRHRSLGIMQADGIRPRRMPQRQAIRNSAANVMPTINTDSHDVTSLSQDQTAMKNPDASVRDMQEDLSVTPPSISETISKPYDHNFKSLEAQREQPKRAVHFKDYCSMPLSAPHVEPKHDVTKRSEQFGVTKTGTTQEMEWDVCNRVEVLNVIHDEPKHLNFQNLDYDASGKSDAAFSFSSNGAIAIKDQLPQWRNFLSQPATQSSVVGTTCATTTSVHSTSAPMLNSTTYSSQPLLDCGSHAAIEPPREGHMSSQRAAEGNLEDSSNSLVKGTSRMLIDNAAISIQSSSCVMDTKVEEHQRLRDQQKAQKESGVLGNPFHVDEKGNKEGQPSGSVANVNFESQVSMNPSLDVKLEKNGNQEKVTSRSGTSGPRKRNSDPDAFFVVNGTRYQKLGKIGSGGSSEVHKVISADCTIYALKKIKLRGRDYATAYGFCQEIEYLNRLKGKNNIIQLINYEVTDKKLLQDVINGSISNKDGKVKDDACIYMVLEYGEIDLAHMLSQKWKEMDDSSQTIDHNWLRFYWQQILLAVKTIHDERIVHSDLKPANFLLVKGSLKLIDFGIAKAIMSDTTNIVRDSQVGTLSYMSPEAFLCNELDANGNVIKCGRSSDIWSLGCILYQMVYGRTPFSQYKAFWSKLKVITDPNHEITYEPVSNPWLLDLMKKCLTWDQHKRWRIPQLLKHPFLAPPAAAPAPQPSLSEQQGFKLLQLVAEACSGDHEAATFCSELQQLLSAPVAPELLTSRAQQRSVLGNMTRLCGKIEECLMKLEKD
ncbi:unnamed protein product [Linum trigynum]|uniref:Protein kinase domain-containing protein n=1 Tax=Linum trigynum TaxID=586398 RepID=A0AAV2GQ11_9ROSI